MLYYQSKLIGFTILVLGLILMPDGKPRSLPVIPFLEEPEHDNPPPKKIRIVASKATMQDLKQRFDKANPKDVPPTIDEIVAAPAQFRAKIGRWSKLVDLSQLRIKLLERLDGDAMPGDQLECALLLTRLRDQRGYDWAMKKLAAGDTDVFPDVDAELSILALASIADKKWVRSNEIWKRIAPRLESDRNARNIASYSALREYEQWVLDQLESKQTPVDRREEYIRTLAFRAPSLRGLKASVSFYATVPEDNLEWNKMHNRLTVLEQFAVCDRASEQLEKASDEEKAEARHLACKTAEPLVGHKHWASWHFHKFICRYGDERWGDYFQAKLTSSKTCYHAFEAIVRLQGDGRESFLRNYVADWEQSSPLVRKQALTMLCQDLAGSRDEELSDWLFNRALNGEKKKTRVKAIRQLLMLGHEKKAMLLLKREESKYDEPQPDPGALIDDLHAAGFGADVTLDDVNARLLPSIPTEEYPSKLLLPAKDQINLVLQLSGLCLDVDCVIEVERQFEKLAEISRGEFDASMVLVQKETKRVFLRVGDSVVDYSVTYPEEYQDPFSLAAIANTALKDAGSPNRFVPYGNHEGMSDIMFYFGNQELATKLETKYQVKFVPGWQKQF